MLTITIRNVSQNKCTDIMVNEEQKISNTVKVLRESNIINSDIEDYVIYSERTGKKISPLGSYRDNHIYNGDILNIDYANE